MKSEHILLQLQYVQPRFTGSLLFLPQEEGTLKEVDVCGSLLFESSRLPTFGVCQHKFANFSL